MEGGVTSRMIIVWTQLALLPQASVAVHVRAMVLVPPHPLVIESLKLIVVWLQPSCAVATPVALVLVSAGQSNVRFGGQEMVGLIVSRTVIVCVQLVLLPHSSEAVQVREMILVAPQLVSTKSVKVTVTRLQPSVAVATPVTLVRVSAGHSRVTLVGQMRPGLIVSRTVIV